VHDFVVIGAGVSGVASALLLAQAGRSVALVEAAPRTMPLLRGFSRHGVQFETGFHYTGGLAPGEPLDLFFRHMGLSASVASFPFREDGYDVFRCLREAFEFRIPAGYDAFRDRLHAAFPAEGSAIDGYLSKVRATCDGFPYLNLDAGFDGGSPFARVFGPTLRETLDGLTGDPLLKALLSVHCLLYGVSPDEVSFAQHASVAGGYCRSARGIAGGGPALAAALDARLRELGVEVRCGSAAEGLTLSADGRVSGVRLADGTVLPCAGCVATLHPLLVPGLLPEGTLRPAARTRLSGLEESVSAFILYGTSDAPIPALDGSNLFVFPHAGVLSDLGRRTIEEGPLYVTGARPPGDATPRGFVGISPVDPDATAEWAGSTGGTRPESYRSFKAGLTERMRRHVEASCPELAGMARHAEASTPLTLRDWCHSPRGGLYGVKHRVGQYNPSPATRVPGLWLAGQGVVSPGILGAVLSGYLACGTILGHEKLIGELKACR
jgi:all-trans-retinol 13,14-reductase